MHLKTESLTIDPTPKIPVWLEYANDSIFWEISKNKRLIKNTIAKSGAKKQTQKYLDIHAIPSRVLYNWCNKVLKCGTITDIYK